MTETESLSVEPDTDGDPNALVAFLDILGTSEMVNRGHFGRATAYDFANPAGIAARFLPSVRFAAFSDSVLITANASDARDFQTALAFVHRQWFADGIAVRGGIALGEMDWAHEPEADQLFQDVPNFLYARVYGRAMVEAHRLEQKAGPGALCSVTQAAAAVLRDVCPTSVFEGPASYLVWSDPKGLGWFAYYFRLMMNKSAPDSDPWRQYRATRWYFEQLHASRTYIPTDFPTIFPGSDEWIELKPTEA